MNKSLFLSIVAAAAVLTGCSTPVARRPLTDQEQQWQKYVKSYYPAWKPALTVPAGVQPGTSPANTIQPVTFNAAPAKPVAQPAVIEINELVFEDTTATLDAVPNSGDVVTLTEPETPAAAEITTPAVEEKKTEAAVAPAVEEKKTDVKADAPAVPVVDAEHVVQKGETLGAIAQKYYGKASMWKVIMDANEAVLHGSDKLKPGMKLSIPKR